MSKCGLSRVESHRALFASLLGVLSFALYSQGALSMAQDDQASPTGDDAVGVSWSFDNDEAIGNLELAATGEAAKRMPKPKIQDGQLYLLESWWQSTATMAAAAPTEQLMGDVDITFDLVMNTGTEGAGLAWLNVDEFGTDGPAPEFEEWEAPAFARSFSVGFDAMDLPNRDPFRGSGNVYDRPQHEISLHWDGREIVKKRTETEFRDEKTHAVRLGVEFVVGGANVSLSIDDEQVFDSYFIPSMIAYVGRPAIGARNGETAGDVLIDNLAVECGRSIEPLKAPVEIVAIDHQLNDKDHPKNEAEVEFPSNTDRFGRIVCTLRLDKPETRFDPWDRIAHISTFDDQGNKYELLRYITPYHAGWEWKMDVSDFRPLLTGTRKIVQECGTYGEGWVVTVRFDFYPGPADRYAYKVINLWNGAPEIGNPDKPVSDFYVPREIAVDDNTAFARVRTVVTGHGMSPNSNNAAEFMPIGRTLTVNGEAHENRLWKDDNYLNPCRPQGGTWKYDRAGWAPGDVVRPWSVDVSHLLSQTVRTLRIEYALDEYVNANRGETWAPTHRTEAQLVLYRKSGE